MRLTNNERLELSGMRSTFASADATHAVGEFTEGIAEHRIRTTSRTLARTRRIVVGCQGRLDTGARIRAAGRRHGGIVGPRLPAPEGGRSRQRSLLVQSRRQGSMPGVARHRVERHCESFVHAVTSLLTTPQYL